MSNSLWPIFRPLWMDLRKISPSLLLAGGYGLFLKQQWLTSQIDTIATVVSLTQWVENVPRATKDFDLIVPIDFIASPLDQGKIQQVLTDHGFVSVGKNARWQFTKDIARDKCIVEFHCPEPGEERIDLRLEDRRVKPKPSLRGIGIHGRRSPEAEGFETHPYSFLIEGTQIAVPHPVIWSIMKIMATRDRWEDSQKPDSSPEQREYARSQFAKHASDLFRLVAMATKAESNQSQEVLLNPNLLPVQHILYEYFGSRDAKGSLAVRYGWKSQDFDQIASILASWFTA